MKTKLVRIYSEVELQRKLKQMEALLLKIEKDVEGDRRYCDIDALSDAWEQYQATLYIVTKSAYDEDSYKRKPYSLFVEREVEDDYSDDLKEPGAYWNID